MTTVRIGVLGCAAVVEYALINPLRNDPEIAVSAIASRSAARAEQFAEAWGIERSHGSYVDLLADRDLDAVYVALPNSMHHRWSIDALRTGFPVLCEKPLAANGTQAREMAAVACDVGLPLVEATHWRRHPIAHRTAELVADGVIGDLRRIEVDFHLPVKFLAADNIRFDAGLGGGSLMDQGCYCTDLVRMLGGEAIEVLDATATLVAPEVDGAMRAHLGLPGGVEAFVSSSMIRDDIDGIVCSATVAGSGGALELTNQFVPGSHPFLFGEQASLAVVRGGERTEEAISTTPSYVFQARHFAEQIADGGTDTGIADSVANLELIDAVYRAAGMSPRGSVTSAS